MIDDKYNRNGVRKDSNQPNVFHPVLHSGDHPAKNELAPEIYH